MSAETRAPAAARRDTRGFHEQQRPLPPTVVRGQRLRPYEDLYHTVLTAPWSYFFLSAAAAFVVMNAVFAGLYLLVPGSIANARPGSFEDAFFYSVETMATIGYGELTPAGTFGHVLMTIEAIIGMFTVALLTGVTFAKFARPSSRVLFTNKILVTPRDGVPHMMFRMANYRHNNVVEATLRVMVLLEERTKEGEVLRRPYELLLVRDRTPLFGLTWTAMHRIDETSLFYGEGALERLRAKKGQIILALNGLDETFGQTIHARYVYELEDIVENARFHDVLTIREDGTREIDYTHFHDYVPIEG